ncbi:chymotrypsin-1-like [Manduca sexta]|uniref:chymotrypsin-1-like n=1 Tax=Manduca sexta TaxID=7130 RepID=UPI00188FA07D|nr:chymotrypsin-1-like [Manduca sexta]
MSIFFEHVDPNARIVGGTHAAEGSHPDMVSITHGVIIRKLLCGGSIISRRTILTAAHCIVSIRSGNNVTRFVHNGIADPEMRYAYMSHYVKLSDKLWCYSNAHATVGTNQWFSGGQIYSYKGYVIHPDYNANTIKNDIGMLYTTTDIVWNNVVRPIFINYEWIGKGMNCRVAGWGRIRNGGIISRNLRELNVQTVDGNHCVREVARIAASLNRSVPSVDPNIELCTFHSRNHGTCNGDSGSALVRVDRGQQIGIESWGLPCALGAPDMYVRLSAFRSWVQTNTIN